jgi:hypothetical protein
LKAEQEPVLVEEIEADEGLAPEKVNGAWSGKAQGAQRDGKSRRQVGILGKLVRELWRLWRFVYAGRERRVAWERRNRGIALLRSRGECREEKHGCKEWPRTLAARQNGQPFHHRIILSLIQAPFGSREVRLSQNDRRWEAELHRGGMAFF